MSTLAPELKEEIDALDYRTLLEKWRFAPLGDPQFQGERGLYWAERIRKLRSEIGDAQHVKISKAIGWDASIRPRGKRRSRGLWR